MGHTQQGIAAIEHSRAAAAGTKSIGPYLRTYIMQLNAGLYAEARRVDLAVRLLEKTLAAAGIGESYSPV
ncbi:MAG: hypothetical protein ACREPY_08655, partial [Rhodanobacteraceae bacterium]